MVKENRSLGLLILFSIITCGIYPLFFYHQLAKDMNIVCGGDGEHTSGVGFLILFSFLTCGIYSYVWFYKIGRRQQDNAGRFGLFLPEGGSHVVLWMIFGSFIIVGPFIGLYIIIKNMNALAKAYNSRTGNNFQPVQNNQYQQGNQYQQSNQYLQQESANTSTYTQDSAVTQPMDNVQTIQLKCTNGEFAGYAFPIGTNETVVIGRDMSCNIKFDIKTPMVSRVHCIIEYDGVNVWITDNNSTYGTFLSDGTKLEGKQRVLLSPGTGFYLGSQNVMFYI